MTPCDFFDVGVLLFLIIGSLWSFYRGFISTLAYVLALFAGLTVACRFRVNLIHLFGWPDNPLTQWNAAMLLFSFVWSLITFLALGVTCLLKKIHLSSLNHLLGLFFGSMLTLVVCWLISYTLLCFDGTSPIVAHSRSAKYLLLFAEAGEKTIPDLPTPENETNEKIYQMPKTFIQRLQEEQADVPESMKSDENTSVPKFLDEVDEHLKQFFEQEEKKTE